MLYPTLTIIRGLPGSGKSTTARDWHKCPIIEADQFLYTERKYAYSANRYAQIQPFFNAAIDNVLACGCDCCVTGVFAQPRAALGIVNRAMRRGYNVTIHTMTSQYGDEHECCDDDFAAMQEVFKDHDEFVRDIHGSLLEVDCTYRQDDRGIRSPLACFKVTPAGSPIVTSIIKF